MARVVQLPMNTDNHLDPDILTAFLERALSNRQVTAVFAHLAHCQDCREHLRVQARLRNQNKTEVPLSSQPFAWFPASSFKIAASFVCAVLGGGVLLLWSHNSQQPVHFPMPQTNRPPSQASSMMPRAFLSAESAQTRASKKSPAILPALRHKADLTSERALDTPTSFRRTVKQQWLKAEESADRSGLLDSFQRRKLAEEGKAHREARLLTSGTLWRTAYFRLVVSAFTLRSARSPASLQGPFAAARLNQQTSFGPIPLHDAQESPRQDGRPIAIRTALGERRFYWNNLANGPVLEE